MTKWLAAAIFYIFFLMNLFKKGNNFAELRKTPINIDHFRWPCQLFTTNKTKRCFFSVNCTETFSHPISASNSAYKLGKNVRRKNLVKLFDWKKNDRTKYSILNRKWWRQAFYTFQIKTKWIWKKCGKSRKKK